MIIILCFALITASNSWHILPITWFVCTQSIQIFPNNYYYFA